MFHIDQSAEVPPFEQIKRQITEQRDSGELAAGHHLPPVRRLAGELGLAPNTVARAYKELEAAGVIETRGRNGSFVTGTADSADKAAAHAAGEYIARVRALGIDDERAVALVRDAATATLAPGA
ncbi:GntR family transcriptional regulator [Kocuria soli]|uniref:GntR family transcriptional regulator n=1 Tax=Kocuria soli TaxID=2485125 RepID=A0A3N3ZQX5_9MICC|nr:GntR family transcriptional regulator [Kocuria soli]ROZ62700.1 GntR family transcriptional regulator [Kocuria soli]